MAKILTIESIQKGHQGRMRIIFKQHSFGAYELSRQKAEQFHEGDNVMFRKNKLFKC